MTELSSDSDDEMDREMRLMHQELRRDEFHPESRETSPSQQGRQPLLAQDGGNRRRRRQPDSSSDDDDDGAQRPTPSTNAHRRASLANDVEVKAGTWYHRRAARYYSLLRNPPSSWMILLDCATGATVKGCDINPTRFYVFNSEEEQPLTGSNFSENGSGRMKRGTTAQQAGGGVSALAVNEGDLWAALQRRRTVPTSSTMDDILRLSSYAASGAFHSPTLPLPSTQNAMPRTALACCKLDGYDGILEAEVGDNDEFLRQTYSENSSLVIVDQMGNLCYVCRDDSMSIEAPTKLCDVVRVGRTLLLGVSANRKHLPVIDLAPPSSTDVHLTGGTVAALPNAIDALTTDYLHCNEESGDVQPAAVRVAVSLGKQVVEGAIHNAVWSAEKPQPIVSFPRKADVQTLLYCRPAGATPTTTRGGGEGDNSQLLVAFRSGDIWLTDRRCSLRGPPVMKGRAMASSITSTVPLDPQRSPEKFVCRWANGTVGVFDLRHSLTAYEKVFAPIDRQLWSPFGTVDVLNGSVGSGGSCSREGIFGGSPAATLSGVIAFGVPTGEVSLYDWRHQRTVTKHVKVSNGVQCFDSRLLISRRGSVSVCAWNKEHRLGFADCGLW